MCLALTERIAYVIPFKSSQQSTGILILQVRKLSHGHSNHTPRSGGRGGPKPRQSDFRACALTGPITEMPSPAPSSWETGCASSISGRQDNKHNGKLVQRNKKISTSGIQNMQQPISIHLLSVSYIYKMYLCCNKNKGGHYSMFAMFNVHHFPRFQGP